MAEVVRNLKKMGAKNREINASIKEVMKTIKQNREEAAKKKLENQQKRKVDNLENQDASETNHI
ncbi:MAG: hypothetical protein PHF86_03085 [Candidatus Nanoarchaeia archaeon]|jgi:hypothetical protein|nr:hypothetical protein [Candidatus Nanoarchaeia archaeon]